MTDYLFGALAALLVGLVVILGVAYGPIAAFATTVVALLLVIVWLLARDVHHT